MSDPYIYDCTNVVYMFCVYCIYYYVNKFEARSLFSTSHLYIVYALGPMTYPCGTPWLSGTGSDFTPRITTDWVLSLKYDSNHLCSFPLIPNSLLIAWHARLLLLIRVHGVIQSVDRTQHSYLTEVAPHDCLGPNTIMSFLSLTSAIFLLSTVFYLLIGVDHTTYWLSGIAMQPVGYLQLLSSTLISQACKIGYRPKIAEDGGDNR